MKTTNLILILLISIVSFKSITPQMIGYIQEQVYETPYRYTTENVNYFLDEASYVSGGLTFTYPTSWFSVTPMVNVSLTLNLAPFSAASSYSAVIQTSTAASVTIRVLKTTLGIVTEANSGDVSVTINAYGQP